MVWDLPKIFFFFFFYFLTYIAVAHQRYLHFVQIERESSGGIPYILVLIIMWSFDTKTDFLFKIPLFLNFYCLLRKNNVFGGMENLLESWLDQNFVFFTILFEFSANSEI